MWLPFQKLHPLGYAGEYMTAGACIHKCRAFGLVFFVHDTQLGQKLLKCFFEAPNKIYTRILAHFFIHSSACKSCSKYFWVRSPGTCFFHIEATIFVLRIIFFQAGPHTDVSFICCPLFGFFISSVFPSAWLHLKLYSTSAILFVQDLRW